MPLVAGPCKTAILQGENLAMHSSVAVGLKARRSFRRALWAKAFSTRGSMSKAGSGAPHSPLRSRPDHPHAARRCHGRSGRSYASALSSHSSECGSHGPETLVVPRPLPASMSQHTILARAMPARAIRRRRWHLKECHHAQTVARCAPGTRLSLSWTSCQHGQVKTSSGYVTTTDRR